MNNISYYSGDVFERIDGAVRNNEKYVVFPHVVNNQDAFGSGLAYTFSKKYPKVKTSYHELFKYFTKPNLLGQADYVHLDNFVVCNMYAQTLGGDRPLYYNHLSKCMEDVAFYCKESELNDCPTQIITVKFGSGLARGNWDFIEQLIYDIWIRDNNIDVTICSPT